MRAVASSGKGEFSKAVRSWWRAGYLELAVWIGGSGVERVEPLFLES